MLIRKVTRIADREGEKDQAVQLSSQVPLSAILVVSVVCRKSWRWFDFTESLNDSVVHLSAGRHLPAADQGFKLHQTMRLHSSSSNINNTTEVVRTRVYQYH